MNISTRILNRRLVRVLLAGMLLASAFITEMYADVSIKIGGDVYGGGRNGAVGTSYTTATDETDSASVTITGGNPVKVTSVVINDGEITGRVFGGGQNGRAYGGTEVEVNGGEMTSVFGAGDGFKAHVYGHDQVTIKGGTVTGNIYGGGNQADLMGSTNVILKGGTILGDVYGGSRVANIYGRSYVNIDGAGAVSDLIIKTVYGGNDISGKIEPTTNANWAWATSTTMPFTPSVSSVNDTWNAFILSTPNASDKNIFVGKVYGGGNGKYDYTLTSFEGLNLTKYANSKPTIDKTYLEIQGGTFGYLFGGGNAATVVTETVISLNDTEENISLAQIPADRIDAMELNDDMFIAGATDDVKTVSYQFERVFGGNDQAPMDIRPTWNLVKASINNLYSGGNAGAMTYYNLQIIDADHRIEKGGIILPLTSAGLTVNNAYGGCRMADVNPENKTFSAETFNDVEFPANYPARVLVTAGTINNVYGGNDISGNVKGGAALEILSDIEGNVYGGGNGSYIYTDVDDDSDTYYADGSTLTNTLSVAALNAFRPQADKSYIHVAGTSSSSTEIKGELYGSGNSATVTDAIKLQLGEYTTINKVFLGSNGLHMVQESTLQGYADDDVSTLNLTTSAIFNDYMVGAAVDCMPAYDFDTSYPDDYVSADDSRYAHIGSFFGGGNVGSMTSSDLFDISFKKPIIITNKIVGGCNNAFVEASDYNARNEGGFTGAVTDANPDKIHLDVDGVIFTSPASTADNGDQGNIFGGCFNSGYITGNVAIEIGEDIIPSGYFSESNTKDDYVANEDNLFKTPLSVFGGGFGPNASIKGNTRIDIYDNGGAIKVYGGGYQGEIDGNTEINLTKGNVGVIYGGGFEGPVTGSTRVNLDGGTVYNSFGGACNADISGSAQTYVGTKADGDMTTVTKSIYGGNDFGGSISGTTAFTVREGIAGKVYNPANSDVPDVQKASAYVEYVKGYVGDYIYGGSRGSYDYTKEALSSHLKAVDFPYPYLVNSFVNFKPSAQLAEDVAIARIFGAGEGAKRDIDEGIEDVCYQDRMQDRSYVLIDIPAAVQNFKTTDIYGAGAESGLGMRLSQDAAASAPESVSAVVDLMRGTVNDVYGASYNEGITRRTVVNVPSGSTIHAHNLFGGGYGLSLDKPCDVFEATVNYSSDDAVVGGYRYGIYGGNNNMRRTLYSKVNINSPVWYDEAKASLATVYGAGYGEDTWSQYTEVNLNDGARVYEVYGGGNNGQVLNKETVDAWKSKKGDDLYLGLGGYEDKGLEDPIVRPDTIGNKIIRNNATVYINKGAVVSGYMYQGSLSGAYAYGGGLGNKAIVSGSTYIGLHGGRVVKDLYAGGTYGGVRNLYPDVAEFTAETNAFIEGGTVRNVYGGGWEGDVGYALFDDSTNVGSAVILEDIPAVSNVTIGILKEEAKARGLIESGKYGFYKGVPTVERNAYSGGEGGAIFGEAHLTINNGYIGYTYHGADYDTDESTQKEDIEETVFDERYVEKLDDETWNGDGTGRLKDSGNAFGGGYVDDSSVDYTFVKMYGGWVRNSLYGGGEIATIGRGDNRDSRDEVVNIFKPGKTLVEMYDGYVLHDVFAGGKGYNNLNEIGKRNTNGYIFGKTEARIYGGVVGTPDGVKRGYGNVFGGGNIGFVYTADGTKAEADDNTHNITKGYYYDVTSDPDTLTEDCKVVVAPACRVIGSSYVEVNGNKYYPASYNSETGIYTPADFVPIADLNTIERKDDSRWASLDTSGVRIYNAVFAGGNITRGSDLLYAEAITVYGNATASLIDAFCLDLIEVGADEIGGLYGDGNLTFVDGYRELNITNYGTDYYDLLSKIEYEDYINLNDRQRAYFEVKWENIEIPSIILSQSQYDALDESEKANYQRKGMCTIYAGRMLNTVQRADFCGIFGSRMVLKGAQDRVPEKIDYTNYTINRLGEISLNKSEVGGTLHGNYFGIYNIVNYLGALTSDVTFGGEDADIRYYKNRTGDQETIEADPDGLTYYAFKAAHERERNRNNAYSRNEVALASGVYLELTRELSKNSWGDEKKEYGPITGVIELELIAASTGEGGGYVYAKNVHGEKIPSNLTHLTLTAANHGAVTQKTYKYNPTTSTSWMESSGNFVTSNKDLSIIDDCFPILNSYHPEGDDGVSHAHFWYIRGYFYVYNQEISAYTGSSQSYSETVSIPLTISAQGNGNLVIENIKSSKYANAKSFPFKEGSTTERVEKVICGGVTYHDNDPISYWDWANLGEMEKTYFVDESYVCIRDIDVSSGGVPTRYSEGQVLQESEFETLRLANLSSPLTITPVTVEEDEDLSLITFEKMFRPTNGMSHTTGHALAVSVDNPSVWNEYFTDPEDNTLHNQTGADGYLLGPTYKLNSTLVTQNVVYGQKEYSERSLLDAPSVQKYEGELASVIFTGYPSNPVLNSGYPEQATFEPAYMYMGNDNYYNITIPGEGGNDQTVQVIKRSTIPASYYDNYVPQADKTQFVEAYLCKQTTKINDHLILSNGVVYTRDELLEYAAAGAVPYVGDLTADPEHVEFTHFPEAYYCTSSGYYGGIKFTPGHNYEASDWAALSPAERNNFEFNYDALDVLFDPTYKAGSPANYEGITDRDHVKTYDENPATDPLYSDKKYVDYQAQYFGSKSSLKTINGTMPILSDQLLDREEFETLLNEKKYYTPISVNFNGITEATVNVITQEFGNQGRIYTVGSTLTDSEVNKFFSDNPNDNNYKGNYIQTITIPRQEGEDAQKFFYCYNGYTPSSSSSGITSINEVNPGTVGALLTETMYSALPNEQVDFRVIADVPQEKSTLYVSRDCDIYDFSQDRILTVIYRYSFAETDKDGNTVENVAERHVLNIRVRFESGVPSIADLQEPPIILPGTIVTLDAPVVEEGAFEVLGGAWEVYQNPTDAHAHKNGMPYDVSTTPMYWYQNEWYVSYYAETYLGRTYSNAVPISVANYHDIDKVMADNSHHLYVDHPDVKRNSKIYIDNGTSTSDNSKTKLDLLYDLFNLSLQPMNSVPLMNDGQPVVDGLGHQIYVDDPNINYEGDNSTVDKNNVYGKLKAKHSALNTHVNKLDSLEFILRSDLTTNHDSWTPIGNATDCFEGNIHGNGYTVTGIDHSLFGKLCGSVFNLGVRGSIDGAGIADAGGYAENTWVINDATGYDLNGSDGERNAVMGTGIAVNSYYNDDATLSDANRYNTGGAAIKKSLQEFMSGEVAYNLNGFYLKKRWSDKKYTSESDGLTSYKYYTIKPKDSKLEQKTGYYSESDGDWNENNSFANGKYVEEYYAYPDFIYAGGSVAISTDERHDMTTNDKFYPIYPDDYIFFGQELSFGFYGANHDDQPTSIAKNDNKRIDLTSGGNRVYRAPGYYGSSVKDMAWFNRYARFRDTYKETDFYKDLTAIDFTGYNDSGIASATADRNNQESFFYPVLDYEGLVNYYTDGLTRNLLVYADSVNDKTSHDMISERLFEPELKVINPTTYGTINEVSSTLVSQVKGHLVSSAGTDEYKSHRDHFLVDKQNFNAPIAYQYDDLSHFMWYQRKPDGTTDRYIKDLTDGWETISLPFTADLVTTQTKGEITHFYSGSTVGHEYWLRELGSVKTEKDADDNDITTGTFASPAAGDAEKTVTNQYLWDKYYSQSDRKDHNEDLYKHYEGTDDATKDYYHADREYSDYPLFTAGKPYLIGFPGKTYYEFDLSGEFEPKNTYASISRIAKQTITFVSVKEAPIAVSDTEYEANTAFSDGASSSYTFRTSYQAQEITENAYLLNWDADSHASSKFVHSDEAVITVPFRPFFTSKANSAPKRAGTRADVLLIGYAGDDSDPIAEMVTNHGLYIYSEGMNICIESTLEQPADVTITTTSGRTLKRLTVQPGTKETVPVDNRGVYIVNHQKVAVTRR